MGELIHDSKINNLTETPGADPNGCYNVENLQ